MLSIVRDWTVPVMFVSMICALAGLDGGGISR